MGSVTVNTVLRRFCGSTWKRDGWAESPVRDSTIMPNKGEEMSVILAEIQDGIGLITLHRPKALNAINNEMVTALDAQLTEWWSADLRALILTGTGRAFAAGADISEMQNYSAVQARQFALNGQRSLRKLEHFPAPTNNSPLVPIISSL